MKLSPEDKKLTELMQPGILCRDGFLGTDNRPIGEIIDTDRSSVLGLGVTHQQIAQRLAEILKTAMASLGAPVEVGQGLTAVYRGSRGKIPSPWGDGHFDKGEVEITVEKTRQQLLFTPLSVHLISEHGFYQGRGNRYRLEPAELVSLLGIEKS